MNGKVIEMRMVRMRVEGKVTDGMLGVVLVDFNGECREGEEVVLLARENRRKPTRIPSERIEEAEIVLVKIIYTEGGKRCMVFSPPSGDAPGKIEATRRHYQRFFEEN